MLAWLKRQRSSTKAMLLLVLVLLVCVALRWSQVSADISDGFKQRFSVENNMSPAVEKENTAK